MCDDYSGYKALIAQGVTEAGCLAHARRKLYDVERQVQELDADERRRIRQQAARPVAEALHTWLRLHRQKVPEGSATAKAIDYSLGRWAALVRYLDDGALQADNNWVENRIRPIALGRTKIALLPWLAVVLPSEPLFTEWRLCRARRMPRLGYRTTSLRTSTSRRCAPS